MKNVFMLMPKTTHKKNKSIFMLIQEYFKKITVNLRSINPFPLPLHGASYP
ncbi:hypothetical protein Echvi_2377 [Echinicola vietnamensis DSM 17526]|uniref:Uncharacterized protein n=1 Tax=Echinicola vietnamensis (strain DSM 17526 / LMG 23754 / KMM 6221) TaxID=926556 RepID=L0G1B1_ECHVK|nr:hypothetical protein Echvi_2377 [Echinicola vietnamensis DSM 17526]